jgi:hypothetical protein
MTVKTNKCASCQTKLEYDMAMQAALCKLLQKGNELFTRTVTTTTTEEIRSDLGAALLAALASGKLPSDLITTLVETIERTQK